MQTAKFTDDKALTAPEQRGSAGLAEASFTLAQLSDPHLTTLEGVSAGTLLNKRLLGYLSWRRRRRHEHRGEVLDALLKDLAEIVPDHIAVTGDLTHLGLPQEFRQARQWLNNLGTPEEVTVIPGNHDTYIRTAWQETFGEWLPYMVSDQGAQRPAAGQNIFPSLRVRGDVALIGVSTAVPTAPFMATGRVGPAQLGRLEEMLGDARGRGLFCVVMIHHPPLAGTVKWRKRLVDGSKLESILRTYGAGLILHGHAHKTTIGSLQCADGPVPVIGIPSSSSIGERPGYRARYHIYRIVRRSGEWQMRIEVRGYEPGSGRFMAAEDLNL